MMPQRGFMPQLMMAGEGDQFARLNVRLVAQRRKSPKFLLTLRI
jgi:hypothetical protein